MVRTRARHEKRLWAPLMAPKPRLPLIARRLLDPLLERVRESSGTVTLPLDFDDSLIAIAERVRPYTMTSPDRLAGLVGGVKHVVRHQLPGAIVECGVWRGGSTMAAALTLLELGVTDRDLYLCDTFAGMSAPTVDDVAADGVGEPAPDARTTWQAMQLGNGSDWARAGMDEVRGNLLTTGYPREHVHFVEGKVEDTLPQSAPAKIALLRLDTDWYKSTAHELRHLYPRLCRGGILIIDDYGHWTGARKAVDEYFGSLPPFLHRLDYTGRLVVKP